MRRLQALFGKRHSNRWSKQTTFAAPPVIAPHQLSPPQATMKILLISKVAEGAHAPELTQSPGETACDWKMVAVAVRCCEAREGGRLATWTMRYFCGLVWPCELTLGDGKCRHIAAFWCVLYPYCFQTPEHTSATRTPADIRFGNSPRSPKSFLARIRAAGSTHNTPCDRKDASARPFAWGSGSPVKWLKPGQSQADQLQHLASLHAHLISTGLSENLHRGCAHRRALPAALLADPNLWQTTVLGSLKNSCRERCFEEVGRVRTCDCALPYCWLLPASSGLESSFS